MTSSDARPSPTVHTHTDYHDPRFVRLEKVFNFRDLGGIAAGDGAKVRRGLVFRSDHFGKATTADIDRLVREHGLKTVVDLRRGSEIDAAGSFPAGHGVTVRHLELGHLRWEDFRREPANEPSPVPFLVQRYTAMAETGATAIRATLDLLCTDTPLVFHCMAGKDRTGITAAVTLGLLGVSFDDIAADYALTSEGLARYSLWRDATGRPLTRKGLAPPADAMYGFLDNLVTGFGSVADYAATIGFTRIDQLRNRLLE